MVETIDRIVRFTAGMDLQAFVANEQTVLAVKYSLLIISEAAIKLDPLTAELCPGIPWRDIRSLGNRLRHEYDNIDDVRIWLLIERNLPPLRDACVNALRTLVGGDPAG